MARSSGFKWGYDLGLSVLVGIFLSPQFSNAQFMNLPAGPVGAGNDPLLGASDPELILREKAERMIYLGLQAPPKDTVSGRCFNKEKCPVIEDDSLQDSEFEAYEMLKEMREITIAKEQQDKESAWEEWKDSLAMRWIMTAFGCLCVVLCGVIPALFLPVNAKQFLHNPEGVRKLNLMLSFTVGSLLGDVFLHIIPETYASANYSSLGVGLWVLLGLVSCLLVEKICASSEESQHKATAIMNLVANLVDNFTHGLAVGGGFLVSLRFGMVTTVAILLHEIPHEISDFAILLRADFDRISAVKAQLLTAVGGVCGALVALLCHDGNLGYRSAWILPFTAGGFLNIALVQVLPQLMNEKCPRESLKQLLLVIVGIVTMGVVNLMH